jgi:hypothetical protein
MSDFKNNNHIEETDIITAEQFATQTLEQNPDMVELQFDGNEEEAKKSIISGYNSNKKK